MNRVTEVLNRYFENVPDMLRRKKLLVWVLFITTTVFLLFGMGRTEEILRVKSVTCPCLWMDLRYNLRLVYFLLRNYGYQNLSCFLPGISRERESESLHTSFFYPAYCILQRIFDWPGLPSQFGLDPPIGIYERLPNQFTWSAGFFCFLEWGVLN